jgi:UDP-N-acetylglucosamine--N-acetylmuramyl-(pentapeptide) pyrophosphoryl-undecaprenol N-acetylglucosamine transferase
MNFKSVILVTGKWRRYFSFKNFIDLFKMGFGFLQALWRVWIVMPDVIFSKGGYGSIAAVMAGWIYRIPIVIHDSDSVPGFANRLMAKLATLVAVSFEEAANYLPREKTYFTGEAIRESFFTPADLSKDRAFLGLTGGKPVVLVLGGSQGAKKINDIILDILPDLLGMAEVIHQTGDKNYDGVFRESKAALQGLPAELLSLYHPVNFLMEPEFVAAMHSADLVISRPGAGSIFEIAASGKASILIPITNSSGNHQRRNAYNFAASGRAEVIEETNLTPKLLLSMIGFILDNPERKNDMETKSKKFATPDAANLIAQTIINLISR